MFSSTLNLKMRGYILNARRKAFLVRFGLIAVLPSMMWMGCIVMMICGSIRILLHSVLFVMGLTSSSIKPDLVEARIVKRLPESFDGKIIHLSVDGHIVRVITDVGLFELRMRFADAV